jgi:hypothetical protein
MGSPYQKGIAANESVPITGNTVLESYLDRQFARVYGDLSNLLDNYAPSAYGGIAQLTLESGHTVGNNYAFGDVLNNWNQLLPQVTGPAGMGPISETQGTITVNTPGVYLVTVTMSVLVDPSSAYGVRMYVNNDATVLEADIEVSNQSTTAEFSMSAPMDITSGNTYSLRAAGEQASGNTFNIIKGYWAMTLIGVPRPDPEVT